MTGLQDAQNKLMTTIEQNADVAEEQFELRPMSIPVGVVDDQLRMEEERAKEFLNQVMGDYLLTDTRISDRLIQTRQEIEAERRRHHEILQLIQQRGLADMELIFKVTVRQKRSRYQSRKVTFRM